MIHSIDFTLMVFSIIAIFLFILGLYVSPRSSAEAVHLIMGGEFTLLFWTVVVGVGVLLPLALEVYELIPHYIWRMELREHNPWLSGIITTSVLIEVKSTEFIKEWVSKGKGISVLIKGSILQDEKQNLKIIPLVPPLLLEISILFLKSMKYNIWIQKFTDHMKNPACNPFLQR